MSVDGAGADLPGWSAASLGTHRGWTLSASDVPGLQADLARLERWREAVTEPLQVLQRGSVHLPAVQTIGRQVLAHVGGSTGFIWLTDVPPLSTELLSLLFLAIGLEVGDSSDVYGRLYDVIDHGGSYQDAPIPVSQTREATGIHTDSSNRTVWPRVVALACVRPSERGGESRLVSVHRLHALLARDSPGALKELLRPFVRDIVTPGSDRSVEAVRANAFPILSEHGGVRLRYMRYWFERGHQRIGEPLTGPQEAALDALDALLNAPELTLTRKLVAGDMLFVNNTTVAHGRTTYVEGPEHPRHLLRLWLDPIDTA